MSNPDWATDGAGWPNRPTSRFIDAGNLRWHVQQTGTGPSLLLIHGTGAATHSWAGLLPLLAPHATVVAPDLPGHGFTTLASDMSLPGMAAALGRLLDALAVRPTVVVGHSAGAAILVRMCLDRTIVPRLLVSLNGALLPPENIPMQLLSPLARLIGANPLIPRLFAWHAADRQVVERLLRNTGSAVPPDTVEFYRRLARRSGHAGAALAMMANWDLTPIQQGLPDLPTPMVMINGSNDRTIPPATARRVQTLLPARLVELPGLGHLAHEEQPALVADAILHAMQDGGIEA